MRLPSLLMFAGIKAPYINGIMGLSDHCFAFCISDRKQYTSVILLTYMVYAKVWFQVVTYFLHILVVYIGNKVFQSTQFCRSFKLEL